MKGLKLSAIVIISIGGLLCLIPVILYIIQFGDKSLSKEAGQWSQFGDFIGGTINPIIGIVNLALLIAISVYVAKFDTHRQFNEYRYKIYVDLCSKFDNSENTSDGLEKLKDYLEIFSFNNQFLFPSQSNEVFNLVIKKLAESITKLIPIREDYEEGLSTGRITEIDIPNRLGRDLEAAFKDWPETHTPESMALKEFSVSKRRLLGFIQAVMIEDDIQKYKQA